MTPEEKINYALSLVEGATPGPWVAEDEYDPEEHAWIVLGGGAAGSINEFAVAAALGGYAAVSGAEWVKANAQQIALSPLIPAALRLALAASSARKQLFLMDNIDSSLEGADSPFVDEMEKIIWGDVLDSLGARARYPNVNDTLFNALDAFLALLPEPPKEG